MKEHNPKRLLPEQVGTGWRLLDEDEIKYRDFLIEEIERLEQFLFFKKWVPWNYGESPKTTFRTKLSREELAEITRVDRSSCMGLP